MPAFRIPGPLGLKPADGDAPLIRSCVAGFPPGPLVNWSPDGATAFLRNPLQSNSPKQTSPPRRFSTDKLLLELAKSVPLSPAPDRVVFYAEDEGVVGASAFVAANPGYTRLDELLLQSQQGVQLWKALTQTKRPWSDKEEVWWELSHRLANAASGVVHVFGPARLVEDKPLSEFRHKYAVRPTYANTVFEKVEWPELEQNEKVTRVYYNGSIYDEG